MSSLTNIEKLFLRRNKCYWCGREPIRSTIDHIIPVSRGGANKFQNLALACELCNNRKGSLLPDELEIQGFDTIKGAVELVKCWNKPLTVEAVLEAVDLCYCGAVGEGFVVEYLRRYEIPNLWNGRYRKNFLKEKK